MHASIAERFAYGTPIDPVVDDARSHNIPRSTTALVGRIFLAAIFIVSGFAKVSDPSSAVGYMASVHIPNPGVLVYVAGIAELAGGLAIAFGFLARVAAIGLFVLMIPIQLYFHPFWAMSGPDAKMQMVQFMKDLCVMGGLLLVVAHGPGRASIDNVLRKPYEP